MDMYLFDQGTERPCRLATTQFEYFVLSVSAMLIVFLMYVNKSVRVYIYIYNIYIYILHIYASPYAQVWACICMGKKGIMILYIIVYDYEYVHDQNWQSDLASIWR